MAASTLSRVVSGRVMHRRRLPRENRFVYPVFYLLLEMEELDRLNNWLFGVNRWRPLGFRFRDYGDGRDPRLWVDELLVSGGIDDCDGKLWLQTFPRVFGFLFNPVSFWYCGRRDGSIGAIVAEVNNTFGERHSYLLRPDKNGRFETVYADKRLYVSPFFPVSGGYRFRFNLDFDLPRISIDYFDQGELRLSTAIWGRARPWSVAGLLAALSKQPLLTLGVIARIHWQALRLWLKGVRLAKRLSANMEEPSR
jgi:DUF1365 family protein